jgi:hypothetical protein
VRKRARLVTFHVKVGLFFCSGFAWRILIVLSRRSGSFLLTATLSFYTTLVRELNLKTAEAEQISLALVQGLKSNRYECEVVR